MLPEKINKINETVQEADRLFLEENFKEAGAYYKVALKSAQEIPETNADFLNNLQLQITACNTPAVASKELSKGKKNWLNKHFGGGGGMKDFGKMAVTGLIKKFIPKIKSAIEKNRPKAIEFMQGKLDLHFKPLEPGQIPERRIVIIELHQDPDGDTSKDDIVIQIKKANYVQVNTARDEAGEDISKIETYSGMTFLEEILASNLEQAIDDVDFGDMK